MIRISTRHSHSLVSQQLSACSSSHQKGLPQSQQQKCTQTLISPAVATFLFQVRVLPSCFSQHLQLWSPKPCWQLCHLPGRGCTEELRAHQPLLCVTAAGGKEQSRENTVLISFSFQKRTPNSQVEERMFARKVKSVKPFQTRVMQSISSNSLTDPLRIPLRISRITRT